MRSQRVRYPEASWHTHTSDQRCRNGKECSPANAGDARDMGSTPGSGRSPGVGNGNPSSILAWKAPWTEEPGGLQPMESQRVRHC